MVMVRQKNETKKQHNSLLYIVRLTVPMNGSLEKNPQESKYSPGTVAVIVVPPGFHCVTKRQNKRGWSLR